MINTGMQVLILSNVPLIWMMFLRTPRYISFRVSSEYHLKAKLIYWAGEEPTIRQPALQGWPMPIRWMYGKMFMVL